MGGTVKATVLEEGISVEINDMSAGEVYAVIESLVETLSERVSVTPTEFLKEMVRVTELNITEEDK